MQGSVWLNGLLALIFPITVWSAQVTIETFGGGANGWGGASTAGTGSWTFTGGVARVRFENTTPFAVPDTGIVSNKPGASSGTFTGDYESAVITLIGFRFQAVEFLPSGNVTLEWGGSTSVYQYGFSTNGMQTGVWYTCTAPLAVETRDQWAVIEGSRDDFAAARLSVSNISIRITRTGVTQRHYLVDDIFLASQPFIGSMTHLTNNIFHMRAEYVQTNVTYHLETAPDITGTWSLAQSFVPTNQPQWLEATNTTAHPVWRLVKP